MLNSLRSFAIIYLVAILLAACSTEKTATEYLASAEAFLESNDSSSALIEARNAARLDSENPDARLLLGKLELISGNPSAAENELKKAEEFGVPAIQIIAPLAETYWLLRDLESLEALDSGALAGTPKANVLGYQAEAAIAQSSFTKAAELVAQALDNDPISSVALTASARLQTIENNIPVARTYLSIVNDNSPEYSAAWELLGDIEASENRLTEALNAYSNAVNTSVSFAEPLFKRARIHLALEDLAAAAKDVDIFKEYNVKTPFISLLESEVLLRKGELAGAQLALEEALKNAPNFQPAIRTLAVVHMLANNLGQAEQYAKQYFDATDSDDSRNLLSTVRLQADRLTQVEQTLEPLTNAGRLGPLGSQVLATSLLKQDKLDEAVTTMLGLTASLERAGVTESVPLAMTTDPATFMREELLGDTSDKISVNVTNDETYLSQRDKQIIDTVNALVANNTTDALAEATNLIEKNPNNADLHTLIARIHAAAGDTEAALAAADTAIASDNTPVSAFIIKSILSFTAEDPTVALSLLGSALREFEGSEREQIILTMGRINASAGNTAQMLEHLEQAKRENPASYRSSLGLANYYANISEPAKVLAALSGLSNTSEQNSGVVELKAQAYIAIQQFDEAINALTPILQAEPNNGRWRLLRAKAYAGKQDIEAVNRDLDVALRLNPDDAVAALAKANMSILTNDLAQADMRLTQLQTLIPGTPALTQLSERIENAKLQTAGATQAKEISDNPSTTQEVMDTAKMLWGNDEKDEAVAVLTTWLEETPTDVTVQLTLANTYIALDQHTKAIASYEAVIDIDEENFMALNNLAWQLREQRPDAAIDYARRALAIQPKNIDILDTLAVIQYEQGMIDDAGNTFDQILALKPENPTILFHGARIQAAQGKKEAAKLVLENLIDSNVNFPEQDAARNLYNSL